MGKLKIASDPAQTVAAPSPPVGVTTLTGLGAMIVGVVVAVLSLFDVVPTDEDVQSLGVIVGAVLFVVPYVVSAISRTKQATNLAKIAQAERLATKGDVSRETLVNFKATTQAAISEALDGADAYMGRVADGGPVLPVPGAGRRASDTSDHDTTPRSTLNTEGRATWDTPAPPAARDEIGDLIPDEAEMRDLHENEQT